MRLNNAQEFHQGVGMPDSGNKAQNNMMNYKIVKCKNWDKDGTCKYGVHCTFAHGDKELRNKTQNLYSMSNPMMMMPMMNDMYMPIMIPQPGMDMNQMQPMMAPPNINQNQFMMMNMMPNIPEGMNNNDNNGEPKPDAMQQWVILSILVYYNNKIYKNKFFKLFNIIIILLNID